MKLIDLVNNELVYICALTFLAIAAFNLGLLIGWVVVLIH
jgi:hypothetical protein